MENEILKIQATLNVILENQARLMSALNTSTDREVEREDKFRKQFNLRIKDHFQVLKNK